MRGNLAELFRMRANAFARFASWEASHPSRISPGDAVAAVGAIYELLPQASRQRPIDVSGVHRMHEALRHLR